MHFFDGANFFPLKCGVVALKLSGAVPRWRGAAVPLMRWREIAKNGTEVRWRKDLKGGARRGGACPALLVCIFYIT